MITRNGNPARIRTRHPRLAALLADRRRARLARFNDPSSAEDDYFRFANRDQ
jgi:hypothetical protein